jgi:hypothetical protein
MPNVPADVPELSHVLLGKKMYVTWPVGPTPAAPVTVAESCARAFDNSISVQGELVSASMTVETMDGDAWATLNGLQLLGDDWL